MLNIVANKKKAFTVVEVLIASLIMSLFLGGIFSLYRMGSNMYISGTWKYTRQKEAEVFLNYLKERVEQASCASWVANGNSATVPTNFVCVGTAGTGASTHTIRSSAVTSNTWLAEFSVVKADLSSLGNVLGSKKGLALYHSILLVPDKKTGLCDLVLAGSKDFNDVNYFKASGNDFPPTGFDITRFRSGNPVSYGFPPGKSGTGFHRYTLHDVDYVTVDVSVARKTYKDYKNNTNVTEESPVFGITVGLKNPKHRETTLTLTRKAKIDKFVKLVRKSTI